MRRAGIDIGSRTIKLVVVEDEEITIIRKELTGYDPLSVCRNILSGVEYDEITATGYGRHLFSNNYECNVITEIKAFAIGIQWICPSCRTVLDIGGQDTKAISLNENGRIKKFEMNEKCAAGTGKFLEIMAVALGYTISEFIIAGLSTDKCGKVNNTCAVFAESEAISMLARGADRAEIARGIHKAIVKRSISMLRRVTIEDDLAFVGGVALNSCIIGMLEVETGRSIFIPEDPQIVGALGCAINNY